MQYLAENDIQSASPVAVSLRPTTTTLAPHFPDLKVPKL